MAAWCVQKSTVVFSNESKGEYNGQYRDQVLKEIIFFWRSDRLENLTYMNCY